MHDLNPVILEILVQVCAALVLIALAAFTCIADAAIRFDNSRYEIERAAAKRRGW